MSERPLDVICMGRSSVDLYGEQVGGRLEDMTSFAKYVGGCPTNVSVGTARLGLKSALITRVGDEHMGRFIREYLEHQGVDVGHVKTDPERLTALVILGIRDRDTFPLIFFRSDCADMAIAAEDFDAGFIGSAKALMVTGTHLSAPQVEQASRTAVAQAKAAGTQVVLDIDYRPVLWGLTGVGEGEERFVANAEVTEHLRTLLPDCDLIVGTEEEFHIAGGNEDTMAALRRVRESTAAVLALKRGPLGCSVFPDAIPRTIDDGITGAGFPVDSARPTAPRARGMSWSARPADSRASCTSYGAWRSREVITSNTAIAAWAMRSPAVSGSSWRIQAARSSCSWATAAT